MKPNSFTILLCSLHLPEIFQQLMVYTLVSFLVKICQCNTLYIVGDLTVCIACSVMFFFSHMPTVLNPDQLHNVLVY